MMTSQETDENDDHHLLVAGYIHEVENENSHIMIPHEILIIITLFCPKQYEILQFDEQYKSKQVIIADDGKSAKKVNRKFVDIIRRWCNKARDSCLENKSLVFHCLVHG